MRTLSVEAMMSADISALGTPVILGAGNSIAGIQLGSIHNAYQFSRVLDRGLVSAGDVIFTGYGPNPVVDYPVTEAEGMLDVVKSNTTVEIQNPIIEDKSTDTMGNVARVTEIVNENELETLLVFGAIGHVERFQALSVKRLPDTKVTPVRTLESASIKERLREETLISLGFLAHAGVLPGDQKGLDKREIMYRSAIKLPKKAFVYFAKSKRYGDSAEAA